MTGVPYGQGARMLSLDELCDWLNITERHARKLVERGVIPYRKVGHLLRFPEAEIEEWSHPKPRRQPTRPEPQRATSLASQRRMSARLLAPKIAYRIAGART